MRKIFGIITAVTLATVLTGCGAQDTGEDKISDLEYTVVTEENVPQALAEVIDEKKSQPFQISYTLGEELYLATGYGEQESAGYSICVNELYETASYIIFDTTLLGPDADDAATTASSYPYIVIKTAALDDKTVMFE